VLEATAESAGQAEKEWQHAARSRNMRALSATPAINVKPVSGGVEIAGSYELISKKDSQEPVSISEKQDRKPA
jgi:hypothetical protein